MKGLKTHRARWGGAGSRCSGSSNKDVARLFKALPWGQSKEAAITQALCKWCTKYCVVVPNINAPAVSNAVSEIIVEKSYMMET